MAPLMCLYQVTSIAMNILNDHKVRFRTIDDLNKSYEGVTYPGGLPKDGMLRYGRLFGTSLFVKMLLNT